MTETLHWWSVGLLIIFVFTRLHWETSFITTSSILKETHRIKLLGLRIICLLKIILLNILASRKIHTRAYPDPNPPEIVDNPERILRKYFTSRDPTIVKPIHKANLAPENLAALSDTQFYLELPSDLPRTKSFNGIDKTDFDPPSSPLHRGQDIDNIETPP